MTNTYMLGGESDPAEIIASVKKGIYCANLGGGQVDITSGKFVFSTSEAYLIEDGKITRPVKGATLIGNGTCDVRDQPALQVSVLRGAGRFGAGQHFSVAEQGAGLGHRVGGLPGFISIIPQYIPMFVIGMLMAEASTLFNDRKMLPSAEPTSAA